MRSRKYLRAEPYGVRSDADALIAGVDEAGCGPLAGPVVAAAVILDRARPIRGLNDSKQLGAEARERLDRHIRAKAVCYAVAEASVDEIDTLNIYHARMLALQRAVEALTILPTRVLVDGNRAPAFKVEALAIVGGDARIQSISAASILAKVHRDRLCHALDRLHPQYGFAKHKGYSTPEHLAALQVHGACVHHRRSFAPVRRALGLQVALDRETDARVIVAEIVG